MAIQSSLKNMVLSLGVICLVGSGLLAGVYVLTKDPIEAAAEAKTNNAIRQVLPEFDGVPEQKTIETELQMPVKSSDMLSRHLPRASAARYP